ncbi:ABC transporter ATP-binding protein [Amorphus sp. 3PC139-8]|uniref:ABC transporter ATP-binding protein n=1 Tax=Amorphus sp. 3PC139-8 TaxID=2735676 RepID=UPI00345C8F48
MVDLLTLKDLTVRFPGLTAVSGLNLTVERGRTTALVGESGSGKSMTALSLMRLLPRSARVSGDIRLDGRIISSLDDRAFRRLLGRELAMIFQEPMTSLNPVMTIGRQIEEALNVHERLSRRAARARAEELLQLVHIPDARAWLDGYPHTMSGGMRQRVMIAIAVACRPKLLIADEPTTALDVTIQAQILALLRELREELDMGLLLVTHDLDVVGQWADHVVVMYAGHKLEEGPPAALFERPLHPYTRGLMASSPTAGTSYRQARLPEIPGGIASALGQAGCPFAPRCPDVLPVCRTAVPPWRTPALGHHVSCHLLNEEERRDAVALG